MVEDFDGNDLCHWGSTAIQSVGKKTVSAGNARDVGHGSAGRRLFFIRKYCKIGMIFGSAAISFWESIGNGAAI